MTLEQTITRNMYILMGIAIAKGYVKNKTEWGEKIGIRIQNMHAVDRGGSFTHSQIYKAAMLVGEDINFVYGVNRKSLRKVV